MTQDEVYTKFASPIVEGVLNGFNGTVLAYGQVAYISDFVDVIPM
jgi:hypothetical protein